MEGIAPKGSALISRVRIAAALLLVLSACGGSFEPPLTPTRPASRSPGGPLPALLALDEQHAGGFRQVFETARGEERYIAVLSPT